MFPSLFTFITLASCLCKASSSSWYYDFNKIRTESLFTQPLLVSLGQHFRASLASFASLACDVKVFIIICLNNSKNKTWLFFTFTLKKRYIKSKCYKKLRIKKMQKKQKRKILGSTLNKAIAYYKLFIIT